MVPTLTTLVQVRCAGGCGAALLASTRKVMFCIDCQPPPGGGADVPAIRSTRVHPRLDEAWRAA